jgi:hypothetical protein
MSSPTGVQRSRVRFGDKDFIVVFQRDVSASTNQLQHLIVTRQAAVSKAFPLWRAAFLLEKSALCVPSKTRALEALVGWPRRPAPAG